MEDKNIFKDWTQNISNYEEKLKVALKVTEFVKNNDVIGFGSGSTALIAVREIAKKISSEGLKIIAIPTSIAIKNECEKLGIKVAKLGEYSINWGFDGADEVDGNNWLIKGRGGAMYSEKLVMQQSPKTYILVDDSKFVKTLGDKCLVPIECKIDCVEAIKKHLQPLGVEKMQLRMIDNDNPYITEYGNYILDCKFNQIAPTLEKDLLEIDGIVESGLFIGYNIEILKA